ncbi:MAG: CoA-binding protein [Desulfovibrionaceae bacterium]
MFFDTDVKAVLAAAKVIAVVGAKDTPGHPVDRVGRYLIDAGYTVHPVHPVRKTVWGLAAFPNLAAVPGPIDIVDLFRAAHYCPDHARECLALDPRPGMFWMQSGITSEEAAVLLAGSGIRVVQDRCLMIEHNRLLS